MSCVFDVNQVCEVSSMLADVEVPIDAQACELCQAHATHPMAINNITCGRAVAMRRRRGLPITDDLQKCLTAHNGASFTHLSGVGLQAKLIIAWWIKVAKAWRLLAKEIDPEKCGCEQFALQMNAWGPDGCQRRKREILARFRSKAIEHVPLSAWVPLLRLWIDLLVLQPAIRRARRESER